MQPCEHMPRTRAAQIKVNRAPVLTLWAAIAAQRLGFTREESLTLGRAVAGLTAYFKAKTLGLVKSRPKEVREESRRVSPGTQIYMELLGRAVPVIETENGLRAATKGRPISPQSVDRYLESAFGTVLPTVEEAMKELARSMPPAKLAREAFRLYEAFRPEVAPGIEGWGARGVLDLNKIRALAAQARAAAGTRYRRPVPSVAGVRTRRTRPRAAHRPAR
jgi:hypothetical protein